MSLACRVMSPVDGGSRGRSHKDIKSSPASVREELSLFAAMSTPGSTMDVIVTVRAFKLVVYEEALSQCEGKYLT